ncbi:unnamed protein product [Prunus brigantina]
MSRWASHFHYRSSSMWCLAAWSVLRADEFLYFFEVRHYKKYAQVCVCNAKLFDNLSQGNHVWQTDVLEVSGRWEGEVSDSLLIPFTYCDVGDSSAGDERISNLLKTNFLSSLSVCPKLVDHIHQANDLDTFLSLSLDKQEEAAMYHL